ncbi:MAG: hypothetical protein WD558_05950 [Pseudomonadales bacterium]
MSAPGTLRICLLLVVATLLASCTGIIPGYEQPQVSIMSFALAPKSTSIALPTAQPR